jgi:DNA-binding transcriptional MerR regulator
MTEYPGSLYIVNGIDMFTIGQMVKKYALSRSTLIYYDSIGLLSPGCRTDSNYRLYSDDDRQKMERILLFRSAGLSLDSIASLLDKKGDDLNTALEHRLFAINSEIQGLRNQQKVILRILEKKNLEMDARVLTKESWVALLKAAGLDNEGMKNWHVEFEKTSPEAHQDFLESIGIEQDEIKSIRNWSKA